MSNLVVVNSPIDWPLDVAGVEVVEARAYLTEPRYTKMRGAKVFNLCRHYRYQATGYYVTLLAEARGHRPIPDLSAIQGFRSASIAREASSGLSDLVGTSLARLQSNRFQLSVYFGRNLAKRYAQLSQRLFGLFSAPLLRAFFEKKDSQWQLQRVAPISYGEVPASHRDFVLESASRFFERRRWNVPRRRTYRYDLAILHDPEAEDTPSDPPALRRMARAAARLGIAATQITRSDYARLATFDALFIRETTAVNHHTFRFARRAESMGLAVIDDPGSIMRCTNKVYLAELLDRYDVPTPRTLVISRENVDQVERLIGLPCVLKQPDSSFSQGVSKVQTPAELHDALERLLARSDLVIGQEFTPTPFDWRIGLLEGQPLFAARYHMVGRHWQIVRQSGARRVYGRAEAVPLGEVPRRVLRAAVRAAAPIGDGLYGVDVKEIGRRVLVIEVNDNPNLDAGVEDRIEGAALYDRIMRSFLRRIEEAKRWST